VDFVDPDWSAPLDVDAYIARIPPHEMLKGMFVSPVITAAAAKHHPLPGARERYLPFADYPLREHARNLVDAAQAIYPFSPVREGLRRLGRGALRATLDSTLGRVHWASATDPKSAIEAILKMYRSVHTNLAIDLADATPGALVVSARHLYTFLDCHHVGVFEGVLNGLSLKAHITVRTYSLSDGDFLIRY